MKRHELTAVPVAVTFFGEVAPPPTLKMLLVKFLASLALIAVPPTVIAVPLLISTKWSVREKSTTVGAPANTTPEALMSLI